MKLKKNNNILHALCSVCQVTKRGFLFLAILLFGINSYGQAVLNVTDDTSTEDTPITDTATFEVDLGFVNNTGAAIPVTIVRVAALSDAVAADYNGIPVVEVPDGSQTVTFEIEPIDDSEVESIETLTLQINATLDYTVGTVAQRRAEMTITDNDEYKPILSVSDDIATEDTPSTTDTATFEVDLGYVNTSGAAIPITIVRVAALSDAVAADYNGIPVVEVPAGSQTVTFEIEPIDDSEVESIETLTLQVNASLIGDYILGTAAERRAVMTITDNDEYKPILTVSDGVTTEGTPTTDVATFEVDLGYVNTTGSAMTITIVRNGTFSDAVAADYNGIPVVEVPAGSQTVTFEIEPIDDSEVENIETLTLQVNASLTGDYILGTSAERRAAMTINDNDSPSVIITSISGNTTEAGGTATFNVSLGSEPTAAVTVALSSDNTDEGTVPNASVTIPVASWSTGVTVTVTGEDDTVVDGNQTYSIITGNVTSADPNYDAIPGTAIDDVIVINEDDDSFTPTLVATDDLASETTPGSQTAEVTVDLGIVNNTGSAIDVNISRLTSTATAADYTATFPAVVSIPDGSQTGSIIITAVDDSVVEETEDLNLRIVGGTGYDLGASAALRSATVSILNNDFEATLTANDAVAAEATPSSQTGEVTVDLGATNTSGSDIIVNVSRVATSDAVLGDYTTLPATTTVTIADGAQSGTYTIIPTDDSVVEGSEDLTLEIQAGTGYTIAASATATIAISDNDSATLSIEDVTVNEDVTGGVLEFKVTLDKAVVGGTTVPYTFANGTATGGGVDFTAVNGTLTFAGTANEEETISVTIIDDTELESSEDFTVQLGAPSNTGVTVSGTGEATGTIGDDDNCAPTPIISPTAPSAEFCGDIAANLNDYTNSTSAGMTLIWSRSSNPLNAAGRLTQDESENVTVAGSYFGYFYDAVNDCAGGVLEIELISNEIPTIVSVSGASSCGPGIVLLSAVGSDGASIKWYDSPTGGIELATGDSYSTVSLDTTTTFYVEAEANGCVSEERVEIVATILPEPFSGTASNFVACNLASTQQPQSTLDLDDRLLGSPDVGVWSFVSGPSTITLNSENEVDFVNALVGDYTFRYTTTGAISPCTNTFTDVVITVINDCTPDAIDLEVLKALTDPNVPIGDIAEFTITVNNLSTNEALNVIIGDVLRSGFEYISSQTAFGSYDAVSGNWVFENLGGNASAVLTIQATVLQGGVHTNTASLIESFPLDDNITNDEANVTLAIEVLDGIDLSIEKTIEIEKEDYDSNIFYRLVDDEFTFVITVKNLSEDATINQIRVEEIGIENFVVIEEPTTDLGTYDVTTGIWLIPELVVGQEAELRITVTVPNTGLWTNEAEIISSIPAQTDGNFVDTNNSSSVEVNVSLPTPAEEGFLYNMFSPNGDGTNDYLKIKDSDLLPDFPNLSISIFDRYGSLVEEKSNITNEIVWDGFYKGEESPSGTYFYILNLGDGSEVKKGWIQLIR